MKEIKRCLPNFSFFDHKAIAQKLEEMAAEGWMIEKTSNVVWTYRRIEPRKLRFAVTYFPDTSAFDPGPTEGQLTKEEFCALDGWQLVHRWDAMQIFCTEDQEAVPIETDPVAQVENIRKTMWKRGLTNQLITLALFFYMLVTQFNLFRRDPAEYLSSSYYLYTTAFWLLELLSILHELWSSLHWYTRAKKVAERDGVFLSVRANKWVTYLLVGLSFVFLGLSLGSRRGLISFTVVWLLVLAVIGFLGRGLTRRMQRRGASRQRNRAVSIAGVVLLTMVFMAGMMVMIFSGRLTLGEKSTPVGSYEYHGRIREIYDDPLPLNVEDLVDVDVRWSKEASVQETFLLSRGEYSQRALYTEKIDGYDLEYQVVEVKLPAVYDWVKRGLVNARQDDVQGDMVFTDHYEPIDPTLWNAEEAYQLHWSDSVLDTYLVCWENRMVEITFFWDPTPEQIQLAGEILRG